MATIERQFAMKNTMGYGLNSLLDHDAPVEMLAHLMIGSEGTLGFVAEAVFRTVAVHDHAATGLLIFPGLADATDALPALLAAGARTAELLDAPSLRVGQRDPGAGPALRGLTVDRPRRAAGGVRRATARSSWPRRWPTPGPCSTGCRPSPAPS